MQIAQVRKKKHSAQRKLRNLRTILRNAHLCLECILSYIYIGNLRYIL